MAFIKGKLYRRIGDSTRQIKRGAIYRFVGYSSMSSKYGKFEDPANNNKLIDWHLLFHFKPVEDQEKAPPASFIKGKLYIRIAGPDIHFKKGAVYKFLYSTSPNFGRFRSFADNKLVDKVGRLSDFKPVGDQEKAPTLTPFVEEKFYRQTGKSTRLNLSDFELVEDQNPPIHQTMADLRKHVFPFDVYGVRTHSKLMETHKQREDSKHRVLNEKLKNIKNKLEEKNIEKN
jgi:hypothetical protein